MQCGCQHAALGCYLQLASVEAEIQLGKQGNFVIKRGELGSVDLNVRSKENLSMGNKAGGLECVYLTEI